MNIKTHTNSEKPKQPIINDDDSFTYDQNFTSMSYIEDIWESIGNERLDEAYNNILPEKISLINNLHSYNTAMDN